LDPSGYLELPGIANHCILSCKNSRTKLDISFEIEVKLPLNIAIYKFIMGITVLVENTTLLLLLRSNIGITQLFPPILRPRFEAGHIRAHHVQSTLQVLWRVAHGA
jgi:hypothetical protein